ncbi:MAG: hypothetical protein R6T91_00705 [Bacteroidales bacterium]
MKRFTMILLAMVMVYFVQGKQKFRMHFLHWFLLIFGAIVVILSYVEDYLSFMLQQFTLAQMLGKASMDYLFAYASSYVPDHFKWWIFSIGAGLHILVILHLIITNRKNQPAGYEQLLGND